MKIDNNNPVGLEWQEVIGKVSLWEGTNKRGKMFLGEYHFTNRSERKIAIGLLTKNFRPYRRPNFYYFVLSLYDPLDETDSFSFNPQYT
jgi:hypothetical protein